ncbi:MAG TPA: hypothetical protein VNY09_08400 [Candidatus Sulfotelmatobacter sp.]|nr:hypothetical protein [Candidatus Sulfotelmatobacter sp.]
MNSSFLDYYLCPEEFARFGVSEPLGDTPGFFRFGKGITCFGRSAVSPGNLRGNVPADVAPLLQVQGNEISLPFDVDEIVENLRRERYVSNAFAPSAPEKLIRRAYYVARPFLSVSVRKHLQRFHLRERKNIEFPSWPLDKTVDNLCAELMSLRVQAGGQRIPFVWFWPDEYQGCVLVTHDVEQEEGLAFAPALMDLDERFHIRSAFQVVPEDRYPVSDAFLDEIRARGFELNVHDLNHDGHLFESHELFLQRARKINEYTKKWGTEGFRSGGMYRNAEWNDAFQFSYDMSFPTSAHLEPQCGGSCSVMPYFLGGLVELPLTTTQDYSLFHILGQYSLDLWKSEMNSIVSSHGLTSFIAHPDYMIEDRARRVYEQLLEFLTEECIAKKLWQPLPRDAARWWRERRGMRVVRSGGSWKVTGAGSERARLAFAQIEDGRLTYHVENSACGVAAE